MKSVMNHSFARVPNIEMQRSVFDRSHGHKTTINADYLYPIFCDEALPGDTFHLNTSMLCRMATPIAPIMDNLFLDTFYFAVPERLLWDNWEHFMGEKENPIDDVSYVMPVMEGALSEGSLGDYLGLPMPSSITVTVLEEHNIRADFFRAYNRIWSDFFRDQNSTIGLAGDLGVVKSGKLPSEFMTSDENILNEIFKSIINHFRENDDHYFCILSRSTGKIDSFFVGENESDNIFNFKSLNKLIYGGLQTYGGCSSGSTRMALKVKFQV